MPVRLTALRVIIGGALALLLVTVSGFGSLVLVDNVSAKSECDVILLCPSPTSLPILFPTPTSGAISGPTPTSGPRPAPTSTPSQNSGPIPTTSPIPKATASPTVTSTGTKHTPVPSPTSISPLLGWNNNIQPLGQFGSSGFTQMLVIAVVIFLFLLLSLGIGLFIFRRTLLPSIDVEVPSSGTSSWSLTGVPRAFVKRMSRKKKSW